MFDRLLQHGAESGTALASCTSVQVPPLPSTGTSRRDDAGRVHCIARRAVGGLLGSASLGRSSAGTSVSATSSPPSAAACGLYPPGQMHSSALHFINFTTSNHQRELNELSACKSSACDSVESDDFVQQWWWAASTTVSLCSTPLLFGRAEEVDFSCWCGFFRWVMLSGPGADDVICASYSMPRVIVCSDS